MMPISDPMRFGIVNFLHYLSMMASILFLPIYAEDLGASNLQVGLIVASYGMAYFISSMLFGRLSDVRGRLMPIRAGLFLATVAFSLQLITPNPSLLLAVRFIVGFCLGMSSGSIVASAYEAGSRVGSFTSYGSLGWLAASLAGVLMKDIDAMFILSAAASFLALLLTLRVKEASSERVQVPAFPVNIITKNYRIYLPFLLRSIGAQAMFAIFPLFLAGIGASLSWIAILYGIKMGFQFFAERFIQRFGSVRLFSIGLLISIAVFPLYGLFNNYLYYIPLQLLLAVGWSCMLVGGLTLLLMKNQERGTAAGLLYSTLQLSGGIGPFLGGAIAQAWGFSTLMFVASGLSFAGYVTSFCSKNRPETSRVQ